MEVGRLVRLKRKEKRMTQHDVGRRVGVQRKYISDIERGRNVPGANLLVSLARVLDIDLNLLKEAGDDGKEVL